jgi:UDP-N-acetylmuramate: L-alanyl-gamma-D-glutamyl-meso-diaminopimelate ligase
MNVHIVGIAGAGVSALASILASQGAQVTGSDADAFPPVTTYLERAGIRYATCFDRANVPEHVDLAIIGTTARLTPQDNPEIAELTRRCVPRYTFAEYLGELTRDRDTLIVAGSFGKSTLTAMIAHALRVAGRDPGWFVGAVPLDLPATGHGGRDREFIVEGDEYVNALNDRRSKFLLYHPRDTLITSVAHDHVNMFPTMAQYEAPFAALIERTPRDGLLVCAHRYEILHSMAGARATVWYGLDARAHYHARNVRIAETTRFELVTPAGETVEIATGLLGLHNIENVVGACAYLLARGLTPVSALVSAFADFRGVARRLDKKTRRSRIPAYEGFGSSYEKARSAIEAMKLHFPDRRLIVVFEPHTFSWRNKDALEWYDSVFTGAGAVVILPPPTHGAAGHEQLSHDDIIARTRAAGVRVIGAPDGDAVMTYAQDNIAQDDVVLLLSSGPLAGLAARLPDWLDESFAGPQS